MRWLRAEAAVLYMVIEHFCAGAAPEIYRRAREHGRQLPPGLEYIDSWVDLDYHRCFQLMRCDDLRRDTIGVIRGGRGFGELGHFRICTRPLARAVAAAMPKTTTGARQ